jgi:hypothetical protein
MGQAHGFVLGETEGNESSSEEEDDGMGSEDPLVQEVIGDRVSSSQPNQSHFYFQTATGAGFSESCTNDSNSERDLTLQLLEERAKVESAQI